jgi:uncharacterized membrane protein (UPF0182 family)
LKALLVEERTNLENKMATYDYGAEIRRRRTRSPRILLATLTVLVAFVLWTTAGSAVNVWLNIQEFGELFLRPFYFWFYGGLILAAVALARIDVRNRRSLIFWFGRLAARAVHERGRLEAVPRDYVSFDSYKMSWSNFAAWQATKVLIGMLVFKDLLFGMAVYAALQGWDASLGSILKVFGLPFATPPLDMSYVNSNVIPAMPALTLILGPVLVAIAIRLIILVGATQIARIVTPTAAELRGEPRQAGWRIAICWGLAAMTCFLAVFYVSFPSFIDYNTRYLMLGFGSAGACFLFLAVWDRMKNSAKETGFFTQRRLRNRILPIAVIGLIALSVVLINNSTADAKKVEWLGPYTAQQIAVNRYLAELDRVREIPYNFSLVQIPREQIPTYVANHRDLLSSVRLWDWQAGFAKLKPEIGLIPYVDFEDSDIVRFGGKLYWAASMKPILPATVRQEDKWYATHMVYTHVPTGFYLLDAQEGIVVDAGTFFKQRRIYYGEGGLFSEAWVAYPIGREQSDELGGYHYDGTGGVTASPPLSWIYEFNFFLAFRDRQMHLLRYRDIYDRMELLFPYFEYRFDDSWVDMWPVTDGQHTYYMMPLIVRLETSYRAPIVGGPAICSVPWGRGNPFMRLAGYALIDIYDGSIQLLMTGDDYFTKLFNTVYSDYVVTEIPRWLENQTRYPAELFEWRVGMYNFYHVTDPATFIVAREFYEVPEGLETYYIMAEPPGFNGTEFIGLLSLELSGSKGRNLAGYMVVRNNYPKLGEMIYYKVPLESETKLLGPTGTIEALEKNAEFAYMRTLLRTPRVGDNILYRVGDHDVYFIPVYTAGAGGVVTEMGTVACVGAAFTGQYYVGLGRSAEEAFTSYLTQLAGGAGPLPPPGTEKTLQELVQQANATLQEYLNLWSQGKYEEAGRRLEEFLALWRQINELVAKEGGSGEKVPP